MYMRPITSVGSKTFNARRPIKMQLTYIDNSYAPMPGAGCQHKTNFIKINVNKNVYFYIKNIPIYLNHCIYLLPSYTV